MPNAILLGKFIFRYKIAVRYKNFMEVFFGDYYEKLDVSSVSLRPTSFVDKNLKQYFSDLVYSAKLKSGVDVKISILLEHKSYPDSKVMRQLLRYVLNLWDTDEKESGQLSLPFVILIYTGKKQWRPKSLRDYFLSKGVEEAYLSMVPDYKLHFLPVRDLDEGQLLHFIRSAKLYLWILVTKYIFESPYRLFEILDKFAEYIKRSFEAKDLTESLEVVLKYLSYFRNFAREDIKQKVMETVEKISPLPDSLYMDLIKEAEKRVEKRGEKLGQLKTAYLFYKKMKLSIGTIADITGLEVKEIEDYIRRREAEEK